MQKDEEVGKVAQATPVVICAFTRLISGSILLMRHIQMFSSFRFLHAPLCYPRIAKALELFLAMLVEEASNVTTDRGSKRVEAYHLYVRMFPRRTFTLLPARRMSPAA